MDDSTEGDITEVRVYLLGSRNSPEATFSKEFADVLQNFAHCHLR